MSTLKVDSIESRTSGARVTLPDLNFLPPYRNILINGDMSIAQRDTSVSSITSSAYRTVDRWYHNVTTMGTWTLSQSTDVPSGQGFTKSAKWDCTTADASPSGSDRIMFQQYIEGQNLQYLKKGTANAESLTASFWVKSNKTGTYIVEIRDVDNGRHISKSYTISSANTWEKKTITFPGDTTGALDNDNAGSIRFNFWLGGSSAFTSGTLATSWSSYTDANRAVGQVNLADSTANEWYITGVQLEAGDSATPFEHLPTDVNLQRCKRYFQNIVNGNGQTMGLMRTGTSTNIIVPCVPEMRATPSLIQATGTNYYRAITGNDVTFNSFIGMLGEATSKFAGMYAGNLSTSGDCAFFLTNNASARIDFNAEL